MSSGAQTADASSVPTLQRPGGGPDPAARVSAPPPAIVQHPSLPGSDAARQIRSRRAATAGYLMWIAFLEVDWLVVRHLDAGAFAYFLALRIAVIVGVVPALVRLYRSPPPSRRMFTLLDLCIHVPASAAIGMMCLHFGGLASPYGPGLCLVLTARTLSSEDPWPRGLVMSGALVVAFYAALFGGAFFSPAIAAQFHDAAAATTLLVTTAYILGSGAFLVVGGHVVWSLRRAIFEARSVGRYKLRQRIGKGATGEVWLAHHGAIKRDIALKILRPEATDHRAIARFEREVRATAELEHPNTVRVFDFGSTDDGLWFYAMELLSGQTLADLVRRDGSLPPERAVHLALQAARALGEAHRRGIVHRDVKPSNLFVTTHADEPDFVKVLDFGIARFFHRDAASDGTLTKDEGIVGTPDYISPEAVAGKTVDARADVYGMGAVLYFMLTGRPPFEAADGGPFSVLLAHLNESPRRPSEKLERPLPAGLEDVVMRCLEKSASARYADANELARALMACAASGGGRSVGTESGPAA